MNDYLQPANKGWRITCSIASGLAAAAFLFGAVILWKGMLREWKFTFDGKPLWIGAIIISVVGVAAAFISLRLARGDSTANGITTLPVWFIQSFGVIYFVGVAFVAYDKKDWLFGAEGASVGAAMVLVSRSIAMRKKKKPNSTQPTQPKDG